jgi:hypothetical protein
MMTVQYNSTLSRGIRLYKECYRLFCFILYVVYSIIYLLSYLYRYLCLCTVSMSNDVCGERHVALF